MALPMQNLGKLYMKYLHLSRQKFHLHYACGLRVIISLKFGVKIGYGGSLSPDIVLYLSPPHRSFSCKQILSAKSQNLLRTNLWVSFASDFSPLKNCAYFHFWHSKPNLGPQTLVRQKYKPTKFECKKKHHFLHK